jgi:hypothetical protein
MAFLLSSVILVGSAKRKARTKPIASFLQSGLLQDQETTRLSNQVFLGLNAPPLDILREPLLNPELDHFVNQTIYVILCLRNGTRVCGKLSIQNSPHTLVNKDPQSNGTLFAEAKGPGRRFALSNSPQEYAQLIRGWHHLRTAHRFS